MATTTSSKKAGAVLDLLMQRSKLSARKVADLAQVSHTTIYARVKGEDWTFNDKERFADLFGVPEDLFDGTVSDAARWLLDNGRFEDVIDLTERGDDVPKHPSKCTEPYRQSGLDAALFISPMADRASELVLS